MPPQHIENGQILRFPPIRKVNLRRWPLNPDTTFDYPITARNLGSTSFADVIWYISLNRRGFPFSGFKGHPGMLTLRIGGSRNLIKMRLDISVSLRSSSIQSSWIVEERRETESNGNIKSHFNEIGGSRRLCPFFVIWREIADNAINGLNIYSWCTWYNDIKLNSWQSTKLLPCKIK